MYNLLQRKPSNWGIKMKQMIKILIYFLAGIMAVSGISDAAVINGGFEEGTLNGWTPNGGVAVISSGGMGYFDENYSPIFLWMRRKAVSSYYYPPGHLLMVVSILMEIAIPILILQI